MKPLYEINNLEKAFVGGYNFWKQKQSVAYAVNKVSFDIFEGETLGLIGESGCGKTTTARLLVRLLQETGGSIKFAGTELTGLSESRLRSLRRQFQIIFQDPYESINPGMRIRDVLAEPLVIHRLVKDRIQLHEKVEAALDQIGLKPTEDYLQRFPHQLSGGQRQRVAVARSLILSPRFIAADEPTSMLDVSVRAEILNLLLELKQQMGLTMLFITHDLATARYMCDRIGVMYKGQLVEIGPTREIISQPVHPYTKALVAVVKDLNAFMEQRQQVIKDGQVNSAVLEKGCLFQSRCPRCGPQCCSHQPELKPVSHDHYACCHKH